jgi:hypothetical protein
VFGEVALESLEGLKPVLLAVLEGAVRHQRTLFAVVTAASRPRLEGQDGLVKDLDDRGSPADATETLGFCTAEAAPLEVGTKLTTRAGVACKEC